MGEKRDRKKKKRTYYEDDDEDGLSNWKLGMVVGAVVICFAMLYPTVFHPMLMGFFGGAPASKPVQPSRPPMHPGMGAHAGGGQRHGDVHPAMRMAQAQAETAQAQTVGGRGMYTWMLPIYTVGVVVFLLYTLFKSKNKKKKRSKYDSSSDEEDFMNSYEKGSKGVLSGKKKLKGLQERLRQTEEAMSKILEQLEKVQAEGILLAQQKEQENAVTKKPTNRDNEKESDQNSGDSEEARIVEVEEDVQENSQPSTSHEKAMEVTRQSDQYISDLEKALKDFKILSEEYESAKVGNVRDRDEQTSSSEKNSDSEESSAESSGESPSETESEDEARPPPLPKKVMNKKKGHKKSATDESVIESESVIPKKEQTSSARRRARKVE